MMKKIIYIVLLITVTAMSGFSQKDGKAKELLDKASDKYKEAGGISAGFSLNVKNPQTKAGESFEGTILMKGEKFYLSTPDADTWFNGKTQWVYLKDAQEVNISEPSGRDIQMMNPAAIFTLYKVNSNYKYLGEKKDVKGRSVYEVELIPTNQNEEISKIVLQINKMDYFPVMFRITNKNKMESTVYISKYQLGQTYADAIFSFDKKKYPKAEIIDLR